MTKRTYNTIIYDDLMEFFDDNKRKTKKKFNEYLEKKRSIITHQRRSQILSHLKNNLKWVGETDNGELYKISLEDTVNNAE